MVFGLKNPFKGLNVDKSGTSVVGIDIGTSSIKAVSLRLEAERAVLETYGEIATGPYVNAKVGQAAKLSEERLAEALTDLLKEANVRAARTVVAIPLKSSFVTAISLPAEVRDSLASVIPLEARRYIPVPISEVALDWWLMPEGVDRTRGEAPDEKTRKMIQVLLVAIHQDVIGRYRSVLNKAKLEPKGFEIESFAAIRSSLSRETAPVAILDLGATTTKVSVVDYGIIRASHLVDRGGQEITLALAQSLSLPFETAETLKREHGLSKDPKDREVVAVMEPILEHIAFEVGNVIRDYQRKDRHTVGRVIATGGGALLPGAVEFLVKKLSLEVTLADPFAKTGYAPVFENVLKHVGPSFSVAVGLALREL